MNKLSWLFSSHYKMERFGVLFVGLCVCLSLCVGSIYLHKVELENQQLSTSVMYTTSFTMSQTMNAGTVENVFIDSAQTKAFILLKWSDPNTIVTDASKYHVYLTGSDP